MIARSKDDKIPNLIEHAISKYSKQRVRRLPNSDTRHLYPPRDIRTVGTSPHTQQNRLFKCSIRWKYSLLILKTPTEAKCIIR